MAGIYVHIPFCRQLCGYCDFHFSVSLQKKNEMLKALLYELEARRDYLAGETIDTLYFGGGTPTVFLPEELQLITDKVKELFGVDKFREMTVEANPDDLTSDYLGKLSKTDTNRLSIGVQSFNNEHLKFFNRRHDGKAALKSVTDARDHGFENITIDLIYGVPGMTPREWENNIEKFIQLDIPHLSAYHLTVEPMTIFGKRASRGELSAVDDEISELHYKILEERLEQAGYLHYEISNFAKSGFEGVHNSNYWSGVPYLGIGPSAHSYNGDSRSWNVRSNKLYLQNLGAGSFSETEELSENDLWNEYLMTRMRTSKGINTREAAKIFCEERVRLLLSAAKPLLDKGNLAIENERIFIPSPRFLLSDNIISELFTTD